MKRLTILLCLVLLLPTDFQSQTSFKGCAPEGKRNKTKKNPTGRVPEKEAAMNRMKNRDDITGPIDHLITMQTLMAAKEETDINPNRPIEVIGYVADVIPGTEKETCNCARDDIADIHIDVVAKKADRNKKEKYVMVEISPRFVEKLGDAASVKAKMTNKWVKFTGWPTYDYKHRSNSRNIKATGNIWRATAWEVHPVTAFKIVNEP